MTGEITTHEERVSSESLGVRGYADLITRVSAFATTELGVQIPVKFDEWERMQVDMETGEYVSGAIE